MFARIPIKVRLTLWYTLILGLILAVFSVLIYLKLRHDTYQIIDDSVEARTNGLVAALAYDDGQPNLERLPVEDRIGEDEEYVRVYDANGEIIFDNTEITGFIPVDQAAVDNAIDHGTATRVTLRGEEDPFRARISPVERDGVVVGVVENGLDQEDLNESLSALVIGLVVGYPIALVVAILAGIFLAGRALAPIDKVTRMAQAISAERLDERLNLNLPEDEVGRLARTFDQMIERLDESFRRQRRFTADASHELRSPLTAMRGQIEVALSRQRGGAEYRETLAGLNEDLERMIRLTRSLLTLARADSGQISLSLRRTALTPILQSVVDQADERARAGDVHLSLEAPQMDVMADEDLLLQLMSNLMDNALKNTPAGGAVTLSAAAVAAGVEIKVKDTGSGIAAEHHARLFDRFYRVDSARSRAAGGTGLGLAISRWIAEAHGGAISVDSTPGLGATFTVFLPARPKTSAVEARPAAGAAEAGIASPQPGSGLG